MTAIGKSPSFPPLSPPLINHQSAGVILEIRPPQHDISCFASHARADRAKHRSGASGLARGYFVPVASPGAGVFPNPMHPKGGGFASATPPRGLRAPLEPVAPTRDRQGASPLEPTEGPCPSAPLRGGCGKTAQQ